MPLFIPIVLGAAALSACGLGLYKGSQGLEMLEQARGIELQALHEHQQQSEQLQDLLARVNGRIHAYAQHQQRVITCVVDRYAALLASLSARLGPQRVEQLLSLSVSSSSITLPPSALEAAHRLTAGALRGAATGTALRSSAFGAVASFGTASTGTAIGTLSGAAAQSATLAWFGGGSMASGGFGMAAGSVVLGGLALGPAVLFVGLAAGLAGEEALAAAIRLRAQTQRQIATMRASEQALGLVESLLIQLTNCLVSVERHTRSALDRLEAAITCSALSARLAQLTQEAHQQVTRMLEFLTTPVLTEDFRAHPGACALVARHGQLYSE